MVNTLGMSNIHNSSTPPPTPTPPLLNNIPDHDADKLRAQLSIVYPPVLARALGMSESALQNWRVTGNGPKFVKLGKNVFYRVEDVRDWLNHNIVDRVRSRDGVREDIKDEVNHDAG